MSDAYRQVLEGKKPCKREAWVPASIQDEDVADFMGAAANAAKAGKKDFKFGDKTYKVTMKKDTAKKIDEAEVDACEECGKVHEGPCKEEIKKDDESEKMKSEKIEIEIDDDEDEDEDEEEDVKEVAEPEAKGEKNFKDMHKVDKKELPAGVKGHK